MDPTLTNLALRDSVWVICERHRVAQKGKVVSVTDDAITVELCTSSLPPQRYDRFTGMRMLGEGRARSNDFFIRSELPERFKHSKAVPPYVVVTESKGHCHAPT